MFRSMIHAMTALVLAVGVSAAGAAPAVRLQVLGPLGSIGSDAFSLAVNDRGEVAGFLDGATFRGPDQPSSTAAASSNACRRCPARNGAPAGG